MNPKAWETKNRNLIERLRAWKKRKNLMARCDDCSNYLPKPIYEYHKKLYGRGICYFCLPPYHIKYNNGKRKTD